MLFSCGGLRGLWVGAALLLFGVAFAFAQNEYVPSSKCADTTCRSAPRGEWCESSYNGKDDGCCPEWRCSNGRTIYGMRKSNVNPNSWKSSWKSSWTSGPHGISFGNGNRQAPQGQDLNKIPSAPQGLGSWGWDEFWRRR